MRVTIAIAAVVLAIGGTAHAGDLQVSLREAISLALEKNHDLKAARHHHSAAGKEVAATRSRYMPRISFEESAAATNSPTQAFMFKLDEGRFSLAGDLNHPPATGNFRTLLFLEQPLLDLSIGRAVEMAEAEERLRDFSYERAGAEIALKVFTSYMDVLLARGRVGLAEQSVREATEHRRLAAARNQSGVGLKSDELRAKTFFSERELQLLTSRNDLYLAQLRLGQAAGFGAGKPVDVLEEATPLPVSGRPARELVPAALDARPEIKEMKAVVAKAETGIGLARSYWLPNIYGSASYQMNDRDVPFGRDNDAWGVGATLRWEMFDGFRRRHLEASARAEKSAALERLAGFSERVLMEIEECALRRQEAEKKVEIARQSVSAAEEGVRLVTKRYDNSLSPLVELLDAQTALERGRMELNDAEIGVAMASARLYHAAGVFLREVMK